MRSRSTGRHLDEAAERHAGRSLLLLLLPAVVLAVVLIWFVPEDFSRWDRGMGWLIALFLGVTWGAERLVVQITRRRPVRPDDATTTPGPSLTRGRLPK